MTLQDAKSFTDLALSKATPNSQEWLMLVSIKALIDHAEQESLQTEQWQQITNRELQRLAAALRRR